MFTLEDLNLSLTNHKPSPEAVVQVERLREAAKVLAVAVYRECPESRERSIAITKLEETVMWAVKSSVMPRQETLL